MGTQTVQNLGAKKNNKKDIPIYRKWQGAIKRLHTKQGLQSNTSFPNHFTKQKDLETPTRKRKETQTI